jgi:competence protein ComEC
MHARWEESPFTSIAASFALGIGLAGAVVEYSFFCFAFGGSALLLAALLALRRNRRTLSLVCGLSALSVCGLMLSLCRRDSMSADDLRALIGRQRFTLGEPVQVEGCVAEEPRAYGEEKLVILDLRGYLRGRLWQPARGGALMRFPAAAANGAEPLPELAPGDRVRASATWNRPQEYRNPGVSDRTSRLLRRGVVLLGRVKSQRLLEVLPGDCSTPWLELTTAIRARLTARMAELTATGQVREAAILSSIVFGDYSSLDGQTRDAFQNSGAYHVLVVSGLHVAWIAWLLASLLKRCGTPDSVSRWLVAAAILLYSAVVGFQASVSRSLWMFLLYTCGRAIFRRAPPVNIALASAFLLLLLRPDWLSDIGFQLSFVAVLAICLMGIPLIEAKLQPLLGPMQHTGEPDRLQLEAGAWSRRGRRLRFRLELLCESCADRWSPRLASALLRLCRFAGAGAAWLGATVIVSVAVQVWLEPLQAYHFNRLTWISPAANLLLVPLSSLVLAAGLIAAGSAWMPGGGEILHAASLLASLLVSAAQMISATPGAWQRCPTPAFASVLAIVSAISFWCLIVRRHFWAPVVLTGVFLACLASPAMPLRHVLAPQRLPYSFLAADRTLHLTFLDVGQGDAILIRFPDSQAWLLDAGGIRDAPQQGDSGFDIGEAVVSRYLWFLWTPRLDRLLLSHPHQDHAGGMAAVVENFSVARFDYGATRRDPLLERVVRVAASRHVPSVELRAGARWRVADVQVEVLHPAGPRPEASPNENSLVLKLTYGRAAVLLAGDVEKAGEAELSARPENLRSVLLKVPHHGSRYATLDTLLQRVQPRWGIISAGRNNPFGHPSRELLLRLLRHRVRPIATLDQGAVFFETDGVHYHLASHAAGLLESGTLP